MEVAHPGVANDFGDVHARKYYTYYQWVCFVLFFQVRQVFISDPAHVRCDATCARAALNGTEREREFAVSFLCASSVRLSADSALILYIWRPTVAHVETPRMGGRAVAQMCRVR